MQFVHYKDFPPVNLAKVGAIGKESQHVTAGTMIYAIGFYEFERKLAYWVFHKQEERDKIYDLICKQVSRDLAAPRQSEAKGQPSLSRV